MNDSFALAVVNRDVEVLRAKLTPMLSEVKNLRVDMPKAIRETIFDDATALTKMITEYVSTCKANSTSPRHKAASKGAFCVLVVVTSAPRAASICGVLSRGGLAIAKLFGKHLTMEEQSQFLTTHLVDVAVGTPARLAKLAAAGMLTLDALRMILIDVSLDEKEQHIFGSAKGGARRPDADELAAMLGTSSFQAALTSGERRAPSMFPVLLPSKAALEASTPVGQRMDSAARGRGRGGGGGKEGGGKGRGRGIHKARPRPSAFAMRANRKGSGS